MITEKGPDRIGWLAEQKPETRKQESGTEEPSTCIALIGLSFHSESPFPASKQSWPRGSERVEVMSYQSEVTLLSSLCSHVYGFVTGTVMSNQNKRVTEEEKKKEKKVTGFCVSPAYET